MLCSTDTAVDSEAPDKNPASFHRNKKRKSELRVSIGTLLHKHHSGG
jgi:hypothetical protein